MRSGTLKELITIQRPSGTRDAAGQVDPDAWTDVYTQVRAHILHQTGAEANRADAPVSVVKASIRIRYSADRAATLHAGMRVVHGAVVYDIKAVLPDLQQRQHIDLVSDTGANNG